MKRGQRGLATRAIHEGYDPYSGSGSLTPPIHVSSTYAFPKAEIGGERFAGEDPGFIYSRLGNPSTQLLEKRIASLEGAEAGVATASGMGAISSLMWTLLRPGDELLTDLTLYGCTFSLFHHGLEEFGIKVKHLDLRRPCEIAKAATPNTKGVFFETPANPNMRVINIARVAEEAKAHGLWTAVDNTYLTPYLQRPIELGADFVVHSATKYLSGHGDLLAGVVCGRQEDMEKVRYFGVKDATGSCMSAFDAHLVLRGLKTLHLRMERHCSSALHLAKMLDHHPAVKHVYYPGLPSDPGFTTMRKQASGFGGMIALDLAGGLEAGIHFLNELDLFTRAVSLGDCESLAQHPASMTHSTYTPEERAEHQIGEGLVRLSVGLEDIEDLEADLSQALEKVLLRFGPRATPHAA
jgi:methionine-gamma-lyase